MFNEKLTHCPACGQEMERGFSVRNSGLSWVHPVRFENTVFLDEDLNEAGLKKLLPAKAAYNLSYRCTACKLYIVDYSRGYSRAEADELAKSTY